MPVTGRKPKPQGQAVNRNKPAHDWTEVVDLPFSNGPDLPESQPDGRPWPAWTARWWGVASSMPHCVLWAGGDWEYAYDTAALKARFHSEPTAALATEIRNRERVLGTTADYRRDLRIRYVDEKAIEAPTEVTRLDDYRNL